MYPMVRDTLKLALSIPKARLRDRRIRAKVTSWRVSGRAEAYSIARGNEKEFARPSVGDGMLNVTVDGSLAKAAAMTAAGLYVTERVDWCWSYGPKGRIFRGPVAGAHVTQRPFRARSRLIA